LDRNALADAAAGGFVAPVAKAPVAKDVAQASSSLDSR
jgi:hypothetical protein